MDKPWKVVLAFLGVFVAGAVFGGFFSLGLGRKIWEIEAPAAKPLPLVTAPATAPTAAVTTPATKPPAQQLPAPQSVQSAQLMRRVTNQLNLTRAQRERVNPFIDRAVQDFLHHQQNYNRENGFLLQRLKQDIARELTPEQQTRLDDLWLKQLEIFRKRQAEAQAQARALAQQQAQAAAKPASDVKSETPEAAKPAAPEATNQPAPAAKPPGGGDN